MPGSDDQDYVRNLTSGFTTYPPTELKSAISDAGKTATDCLSTTGAFVTSSGRPLQIVASRLYMQQSSSRYLEGGLQETRRDDGRVNRGGLYTTHRRARCLESRQA